MLRGMTRGAATHSQRLETWLGKEETARVSARFKDFYWPVPVHGVPGRVYVMPGGDFAGAIEAGQEVSALDRADAVLRRHQRTTTRYRLAQMFPRQRGAFGDMTALLQAQRGGKAQNVRFRKTITTGTAANPWADGWYSSSLPAAGGVGGAAGGGTVPTSATTGAMAFTNPSAANTSHLAAVAISIVNNGNNFVNYLLYDRLFSVAKTMNSTTTEAVTGVPTRYTNQTSTAGDYIGGNFCFPAVTTNLAATAHNWTVCKYTNQAGTTGQSIPSAAGASANGNANLDIPNWFMPLASGDVGVKALTQMQCSAAVATGAIDFVVGHVLAAMPCPLLNLLCLVDGINTAFNLVTVYDNACLSLLSGPNSASVPIVVSGDITLVSE